MRRSIKIRFAMIFVGLMALVLASTWCINNWFLEDFYMRDRVRILEKAYQEIDQISVDVQEYDMYIVEYYQRTDSTDIKKQGPVQKMLRRMSEKNNLTFFMVDSTSDVGVSNDFEYLKNRLNAYIFGMNSPENKIIKRNDNYYVQKTYDRQTDSYYLESWGYLSDNRTILLISIPLSSISESVNLSNRFLAYVGVIALLVGSVFVYLATRKIISPILQLSNISEKMSKLDFEAKYTGDAEDEIGILGNSMNTLSDTLKETIGKLQSANAELQRDIEEKIKVDEMRKDFIANVSHELKTPIALIQGYAEGLTEGMAEDPESRDYYCEVIMDEANKMNKMVRQLLTLTAIEFGNDSAAFDKFDLTELVRAVINSAGILIRQKEANVHLQEYGPVMVIADEFKIEEVVTNYLNNALNHLDDPRNIVVTVEGDGKEALVTMFNSGQSIPEEDIPNLWTKFYKVDKAHTRAYGGSGIGLSIVKAIIEAHHKNYGVRNVEGGVEFWFTLDCAPEGISKE